MADISSYRPYFHIRCSESPRRAEQFVEKLKTIVSSRRDVRTLAAELREAAKQMAGAHEQWLVQMVRDSTDLWIAETEVIRPGARATTV